MGQRGGFGPQGAAVDVLPGAWDVDARLGEILEGGEVHVVWDISRLKNCQAEEMAHLKLSGAARSTTALD
jgi:hypothetical protein